MSVTLASTSAVGCVVCFVFKSPMCQLHPCVSYTGFCSAVGCVFCVTLAFASAMWVVELCTSIHCPVNWLAVGIYLCIMCASV